MGYLARREDLAAAVLLLVGLSLELNGKPEAWILLHAAEHCRQSIRQALDEDWEEHD